MEHESWQLKKPNTPRSENTSHTSIRTKCKYAIQPTGQENYDYIYYTTHTSYWTLFASEWSALEQQRGENHDI